MLIKMEIEIFAQIELKLSKFQNVNVVTALLLWCLSHFSEMHIL